MYGLLVLILLTWHFSGWNLICNIFCLALGLLAVSLHQHLIWQVCITIRDSHRQRGGSPSGWQLQADCWWRPRKIKSLTLCPVVHQKSHLLGKICTHPIAPAVFCGQGKTQSIHCSVCPRTPSQCGAYTGALQSSPYPRYIYTIDSGSHGCKWLVQNIINKANTSKRVPDKINVTLPSWAPSKTKQM